MHDLEQRTWPTAVEFRASDSGPGVLTGYAAKYGTLSRNLGGFVETIRAGAFDKSLADGVRVMARFNHDSNGILGTTDAGTLQVASDGTGLRYTVDLPDTSTGRDVAALAARGDLAFSSFAFRTIDDSWSETDQGYPLRELRAVQLVDVAPVADPAYLDTSVAKRSLAAATGLPVGDLDSKSPDEIRAILAGHTDHPEQREPHSGWVFVQQRLLELQELR